MRSRARWTAALAMGLLGLTGCGGQASSTVEPRDTASPSEVRTTSSAPSAETCPYLTEEQVSTAVGTPTVETAGTMHACFFDPVDADGPSVMLSRVDVQIDPTDYAVQSRALCKGDVVDVDAGDQAFACVMGLGPQGQVYAGRVLITVNINGATGDEAGIEAAAKLLPEVTVPPAT